VIQLAFDLPWRSADGAEDFLVAPSNEAAVGWMDRWPGWPAGVLLLTGPAAAGKSHLAGLWRRRTGAQPLTLAGLAEIAPAALAAEAPRFLLDPARPAAEEEEPLLHLLNIVKERQGAALLVAETPPSQWSVALPDLRSRLLALPHAAIGAPDDALLGALLVKLFRDRGLIPGPGLVQYLLRRVERSCAAVREAVAALDGAALAAGRPVSVALARAVLADRGFDDKISQSRNRRPA
jgi:chromosomal replication initiation ATPase DnaA